MCVPATCTDGVKDGTETDVDCGGDLPRLRRRQEVRAPAPTARSGVCDRRHVCQAPTCTDGVKNGTETDVDCGGGACARAARTGKTCAVDADCTERRLRRRHLPGADLHRRREGRQRDRRRLRRRSCAGHVRRRQEVRASTATAPSSVCTRRRCACGADLHRRRAGRRRDRRRLRRRVCPACATGKKCTSTPTAPRGVCDARRARASPAVHRRHEGRQRDRRRLRRRHLPHAAPSARSAPSTPTAPPSACDAPARLRRQPVHRPRARTATETDVDCGGTCPTCAVGKKCASTPTARATPAPAGAARASPTCTDGVKDGIETDVDCGGACATCATGKKCNVNSDCTSGYGRRRARHDDLRRRGLHRPRPVPPAGTCNPSTGVCSNPTKAERHGLQRRQRLHRQRRVHRPASARARRTPARRPTSATRPGPATATGRARSPTSRTARPATTATPAPTTTCAPAGVLRGHGRHLHGARPVPPGGDVQRRRDVLLRQHGRTARPATTATPAPRTTCARPACARARP